MAISAVSTQSLIASLGYLDTSQTDEASDSTSLASILSSQSSSSSSTALSSSASTSGISQLGQLFSAMAKLKDDSPEEFKEMAAAIAKDFNAAAGQSSDTMQALSLRSVARQFSNASLSGSMTDLNPATAAASLTRVSGYKTSLSLIDYLGGGSGTDFSGQYEDILQQNLAAIASKA